MGAQLKGAASALSSFNFGVGLGVPTRSVSVDEAAIRGIPRSRFLKLRVCNLELANGH